GDHRPGPEQAGRWGGGRPAGHPGRDRAGGPRPARGRAGRYCPGRVSFGSDARSLSEILAMYEAEGFTAQFGARPGGRIVCFSCRYEGPATDFELVSLARTEGASDPDDMLAVAALRCAKCGADGTLVMGYGP